MACLYIGGICLCKWVAGIEGGSPHLSPLKHFQKDAQKALPILCSPHKGQAREGFTLASGFWVQIQRSALSHSLSLSLSHTYSPGQWLYFNMVMIRDGGSGKGGEGAHIYCRRIWWGVGREGGAM